jgi:hypothetical protein
MASFVAQLLQLLSGCSTGWISRLADRARVYKSVLIVVGQFLQNSERMNVFRDVPVRSRPRNEGLELPEETHEAISKLLRCF